MARSAGTGSSVLLSPVGARIAGSPAPPPESIDLREAMREVLVNRTLERSDLADAAGAVHRSLSVLEDLLASEPLSQHDMEQAVLERLNLDLAREQLSVEMARTWQPLESAGTRDEAPSCVPPGKRSGSGWPGSRTAAAALRGFGQGEDRAWTIRRDRFRVCVRGEPESEAPGGRHRHDHPHRPRARGRDAPGAEVASGPAQALSYTPGPVASALRASSTRVSPSASRSRIWPSSSDSTR